jgi:tetratricopeptide (TPR) repeat protein
VTPAETFNNACKSCHTSAHTCTAKPAERQAVNDNCYSCHMRISETMDIPHVTVHDHKISKPVHYPATKGNTAFTGLACITNNHPDALLMADGYMQFYEAYTADAQMLDSAAYYLNRVNEQNEHYYRSLIRLNYLKKDYPSVISLCTHINNTTCTDVYALYHIGFAYMNNRQHTEAAEWLNAAARRGALVPEVMQALGNTYAFNREQDKAQPVFEKLVQEAPYFLPAHNSLGWLYFLKNDYTQALSQFEYVLNQDPDNETALLNLAQVLLTTHEYTKAKKALEKALLINPKNAGARQALQKLNTL